MIINGCNSISDIVTVRLDIEARWVTFLVGEVVVGSQDINAGPSPPSQAPLFLSLT